MKVQAKWLVLPETPNALINQVRLHTWSIVAGAWPLLAKARSSVRPRVATPDNCLCLEVRCGGWVVGWDSNSAERGLWLEKHPLSPFPTNLPSLMYSKGLDSAQGDLALEEAARTRPFNLLYRSWFLRHIMEHTSSRIPAQLSTLYHLREGELAGRGGGVTGLVSQKIWIVCLSFS